MKGESSGEKEQEGCKLHCQGRRNTKNREMAGNIQEPGLGLAEEGGDQKQKLLEWQRKKTQEADSTRRTKP